MARLFGNGIDLANQRIVNVADPSSATDGANKQYVDAVARGLDWKEAVRVATTTNGTLASAFENGDSVDGVTLATGDRILIKDQSSGAENGIYTVNASGAPTRAVDADSSAEVTSGMAVTVMEGTTNGDKVFMLTTNDPITLGSTALSFSQLGGGSGESTVAGTGATLSGSTVNVNAGATPGTGGPGGGLVANADDLVIDTAIVVRKHAVNIGDNSTTSITVTHNLGTLDTVISVFRVSDGVEVYPDIVHATTNTTTVIFAVAPTTNQYRVVHHA